MPFLNSCFPVTIGEGVSQAGSIIDLGVEQGLIAKGGAWYTFSDGEKVQGREDAKAYLKDSPDMMADLYEKLAYESEEE